MSKSLEDRFHEEMEDLFTRTGRATGYWPSRYLQKVRRVGGLQAAKEWLNPEINATSGLVRLADEGRVDLSLEALVQQNPWSSLFTPDELQIAKERIASVSTASFSEIVTSKPKRNPPWTRDELILALDCYFRNPPNAINQTHPEIVELSKILNNLPIHLERWNQATFRNPNGVYMKLCNFLRFDPNYEGSGLKAGGKLEEKIWHEFSGKRQALNNLAQLIRASTLSDNCLLTTVDEEEFPEGKIVYREHRERERSRKLVKQAKQARKNRDGHLTCEVCNFDFHKTYGSLGEDYIECHHIKPVSQLKSNEKTTINDLALVCANCHRMLHRKRPWLHPLDLREIVQHQT